MSESTKQSTSPIACSLDPATYGRRQDEIQETLFAHCLAKQELADGYSFRFPGEPEVLKRLAEFVLFERQCCPFFTFELTFEPDQGPATLRMRGPEGTKQFLEGTSVE